MQNSRFLHTIDKGEKSNKRKIHLLLSMKSLQLPLKKSDILLFLNDLATTFIRTFDEFCVGRRSQATHILMHLVRSNWKRVQLTLSYRLTILGKMKCFVKIGSIRMPIASNFFFLLVGWRWGGCLSPLFWSCILYLKMHAL